MSLERPTVEELYHNLFRMHSYVELLAGAGGANAGVLRNADLLLRISHARALAVLGDAAGRWLEPPPARAGQGG